MIRASGADIVGIEEGEHNAGVIASALGWYASDRTQVISRFPIVDPPGGDGRRTSGSRSCPGGSSRSATSTCRPTRTARTRSATARSLAEVLGLERPSGCRRSRPARRAPAARRERDADVPDRRLQLAVAPRLDRGRVGRAARGPLPRRLAGQPRPRRRRPARLVPRGPSRSGRRAGLHLDARRARERPARGPRPDRLGARERAGDGARQHGRRRGRRTRRRHRLRPVADRPSRRPLDLPRHAGRPRPVRGAVGAAGVRRRHARGPLPDGQPEPASRSSSSRPAGSVERGRSAAVGPPASRDGTATFATAAPRTRRLRRDPRLGRSVVSRAPFWLYAPGTPTTVWTSKRTYVVGEPIVVSWRAAPGIRWDWLARYSPGDTAASPHSAGCNAGCTNNGRYLLYVYTKTAIEGRRRSTPRRSWAARPGR